VSVIAVTPLGECFPFREMTGMDQLIVKLGERRSEIVFAEGGDDFATELTARFGTLMKTLVVADSNTAPLAEVLCRSLGGTVSFVTIPAGEQSKSTEQLAVIHDALAEIAADRTTPVIAVGGGVVGDLAGFAAATWNRGLPLVMVPTTLLAMVDSSVGGKVGINHAAGKNLIGAFHQPKLVWIDIRFLNSLPERDFRSGLAEVVKYGVIFDAEFFAFLETNVPAILERLPSAVRKIVLTSCRLKASVVEQDEYETTGLRAKLNYGHTFGHAFEAVAGYGSWSHGEAVAAGMVCASRLAAKLGRISDELNLRQERLLADFGLPVRRDPAWEVEAMLHSMRRDKKNAAGKLRFVLPTRLGEVELVSDVPEGLVREVLA